jgi:hypothetical protein
MDERADALDRIVALARQHRLSAAEIAAAIGESATVPERRARNILVHVLGVLGGIFVFAGVGVFIALQWDDLNSAARIVITLGPGIAAFVLAVLAARDPRVARAATPLFLSAAVLEPTGMLVAFAELGSGGDWRWAGLVTAGVMAAQLGAAFAALQRSTLLFLTLVFGTLFWWTALDLADVDGTLIAMVLGAAMLLAAVWTDRTGRGDITPFWYFAGAAAFLAGFFDAVERTPFELAFPGVAAGFVYASAIVHSRTLLSVATLAILAYTGWFTSEHFVDSIGWPLALVALGLALIGLSAFAVRIDREYVRPRPEPNGLPAPRGEDS